MRLGTHSFVGDDSISPPPIRHQQNGYCLLLAGDVALQLSEYLLRYGSRLLGRESNYTVAREVHINNVIVRCCLIGVFKWPTIIHYLHCTSTQLSRYLYVPKVKVSGRPDVKHCPASASGSLPLSTLLILRC